MAKLPFKVSCGNACYIRTTNSEKSARDDICTEIMGLGSLKLSNT